MTDAVRLPLPSPLPVAFDRCPREDPPLFDLGGGHQAACLLV